MCIKRIFFFILKYLLFQFSIRKLVCWDKTKISLLSIHQCFRVLGCRRHPFLPCEHCTKMKFLIKDFFSQCDQIRKNLRNWSHLLDKSLMESFIFCAVWNFDPLESQKQICTCQISKSSPKDIWTKMRFYCHFQNTCAVD